MYNKEGWLTKEGGSFIKNWKKRWAVLDYATGTLSYFETPKPNEKPLGVVIVRGATVTQLAKSTKGKDHCFVIANNDRSFFAYVDSKKEVDSWVNSLKKIASETAAPTKVDEAPGFKRQLYTGYLTKEAGSGINWKKRWFILDTEYLSYYKDKKATTPQGSIYIRGAQCYQLQPPDPQVPFIFIVQPFGDGARKYRVAAVNQENLSFWVEQISKAIQWAGTPDASTATRARQHQYEDDEEEDDLDNVPPPPGPAPGRGAGGAAAGAGKLATPGSNGAPQQQHGKSDGAATASSAAPRTAANAPGGLISLSKLASSDEFDYSYNNAPGTGLFEDKTDQQIYVEKEPRFLNHILGKTRTDIGKWLSGLDDTYFKE